MAGENVTHGMSQLSDLVVTRIFKCLGAIDLVRVSEVSLHWNRLASSPELWKIQSLKCLRSLESDHHLWKVLDPSIQQDDESSWRAIYPKVRNIPQEEFRLEKAGIFVCNVVAFLIDGAARGKIVSTVNVERRFRVAHLATFLQPDASFYFCESITGEEMALTGFSVYLESRKRVGLALDGDERIFFFLPDDSVSDRLGYEGSGIVMARHGSGTMSRT